MPKWYPFLLSKRGDNGLLSHVSADDGVFVQKDSLTGARRQFTKFKNHQELYDYITSLPQEQRCFYETILGDRPHKMYFDIDGGNTKPEEIVKIIDEIVKRVKKLFTDFSLPFDVTKNILIFSSSDAKKQSYHLVIDGYVVDNYKCAKEFYDRLKIPDNPYVDRSMYSSKQQFRLLGCQKLGSKRIKRYVKEYSTYIFPDVSNYELFCRSCVCFVEKCERLPIGEKIKKKIEVADIDIKNVPNEVLDPLFEIYDLDDVTGGLVKLIRKNPGWCSICERVHENENAFLIVREENEVVESIDMVCFRDESHRKRLYTYIPPVQEEPPRVERRRKKKKIIGSIRSRNAIAYLQNDLMK